MPITTVLHDQVRQRVDREKQLKKVFNTSISVRVISLLSSLYIIYISIFYNKF